jgi:uracil-DNA glycosylase
MKGKVTKFNKSDLKYKKIKLLTKCILNPNMNSSILEEDTKEFNSSLKYRMFNHVLNFPKVIKYINSHINDMFSFNKYTPAHWIKTFAVILRSNNVTKTNQLYYPKFKASPRDAFFKTVKAYYIQEGRELNLNELNCVWDLYNNKVITTTQIESCKNINSGKEIVKGSNHQQKREVVEKLEVSNTSNTTEFITSIQKYISSRAPCLRHCKYQGNPNLIIKTSPNVKLGEEVDIAIIGFGPTQEEINNGELLNSKMGQTLIELLDNEVPNSKYIYTNIMLCKTPDDMTTTKLKKEIKICREVVNTILSQYPSKLKVILGDNTKRAYGITLPMTKCHKRMTEKDTIVMNSLEEVAKTKTKRKAFTESIGFIKEKVLENKSIDTMNSVELPDDEFMDRIEKGWLLWDTQIINKEFILYTFTHNETMEKKYIKKDVLFPIYIKKGDFKHCEYITSDVDDVIMLDAYEKNELQKQLNWNCRRVIKNV